MRKLMMATLFAAAALAPLAAANAAMGGRTDMRGEGGVAFEAQHDGERDHQRGDGGGGGRPASAPAPAQRQEARPQPQAQQAPPQAQAQVRQAPQFQRQQALPPQQAQGGGGFQGGRYDRRAPQQGQPQLQAQAQGQAEAHARFRQQPAGGGYAQRGFDPGQRGAPPRPGGQGFAPDQYRRDPAYRAPSDPGRYAGGRYQQGYRQGFNQGYRGGWDRGWRNEGRFNWAGYRASHYELYRLPRYYAPYGWSYGYRRFAIGVTLDEVLFSQNYWIDDPWYYRLPPVDGEYRWVRYYNDALLIDLESGEVVDAVYGIFY